MLFEMLSDALCQSGFGGETSADLGMQPFRRIKAKLPGSEARAKGSLGKLQNDAGQFLSHFLT